MTTTHTPGSWSQGDGYNTHTTSVFNRRGFRIARAEQAEDAALIAAAPDMLAALLAIIEEAGPQFGKDDGPGTINRIAYLARQAAAKAEGGAA